MRKARFIFMLMISCLLLNVFPASAGEWVQNEDEKWQYIDDDGEYVTGWQDIDEQRYYFDEDGIRKEDYWKKYKGSWYYLGEDGVMVTDAWVDNYYIDKEGKKVKQR